jgi:hypothetical protein
MSDRFVMRLRPSECQLLPQYQDFGFQPPPALEAVAQHADEKEGNCNHVTREGDPRRADRGNASRLRI